MKQRLDRFVLGAPLGHGGQGSVYQAEEQCPGGLTRKVALKVFPLLAAGDKAGERRFLDEARILLALSGHPHVVGLHGMGITEGTPWLAMEFLPTTLENLLTEGPGPAWMVHQLLSQMLRTLDFMHTRETGLLHQDLKPANILWDAYQRFRLGDFGMAGRAGVDRTHVMATVRYAAPELLSRDHGKVAAASDLYALGHVAYELALGQKLYRAQFPAVYEKGNDGPPARWMAWHCSTALTVAPVQELLREFPAALSQLLVKLMIKPQEDRYRSAAEAIAFLDKSLIVDAAPAAPMAPVAPVTPAAPAVSATGHSSAAPAQVSAGASKAAPPTPGKTAPGPLRYYVRLRGISTGPFDLATLQRQARQGQLSRLHQVSTDQVTWLSAATLEGVFS